MTNYPMGGSAGLEPVKWPEMDLLEEYVKEVNALIKESQTCNYSEDEFDFQVRAILARMYVAVSQKAKQRKWTGSRWA